MVDRNYLLRKPPPPPPWKQFLDLTVLPAMIDAAGAVEGLLERVAVQGRQRPALTTGMALGLACGLALLVGPRKSRN
ncbi:MAG TPA: hypothetical protein VGC82_20255 [Rhodopila sp.]|jgi:hypothetical protein